MVSYTTNKVEQARGGQKETTVPMELDHVSGGEMYGEDWEDVDEVRRYQRCYNCGMAGHIARDCRTKSKGKGQGRDGGKGYTKGKGTMVKGAGKRVRASPEVSRENREVRDIKDSAGQVAR